MKNGLTTSIKGILTCLVSYKPSVDVAVCSGLRSSDDQITCANVPMFRWSDTISSWAEQFSGPRATHQHRTDKIEIHHLTHFRWAQVGVEIFRRWQEEILGEKKVIANKTRRKLIKFLLALTFSN